MRCNTYAYSCEIQKPKAEAEFFLSLWQKSLSLSFQRQLTKDHLHRKELQLPLSLVSLSWQSRLHTLWFSEGEKGERKKTDRRKRRGSISG
jgi:hypothetical protein